MDLHSLHRPTNTQNSHQQSSSKTDQHAEQDIACHWKHELSKMEKIANQALEKLERKKTEKQALKAELASWRARYHELAQAQMQALATKQKDQAAHAQKTNELQVEHDEIKQRLLLGAKAVRELKAGQAELEATRKKLQASQAEAEGARKKLQASQAEAEGARKKLQASQAEVEGARKKLQASQTELAATQDKLRAVQLEVAPTREKLRAAVRDSSQKTDKLAACVDMLARAEQVLDTCSKLHAKSSDSYALAAALATTTKNFTEFRQSLDCAKQAF